MARRVASLKGRSATKISVEDYPRCVDDRQQSRPGPGGEVRFGLGLEERWLIAKQIQGPFEACAGFVQCQSDGIQC